MQKELIYFTKNVLEIDQLANKDEVMELLEKFGSTSIDDNLTPDAKLTIKAIKQFFTKKFDLAEIDRYMNTAETNSLSSSVTDLLFFKAFALTFFNRPTLTKSTIIKELRAIITRLDKKTQLQHTLYYSILQEVLSLFQGDKKDYFSIFADIKKKLHGSDYLPKQIMNFLLLKSECISFKNKMKIIEEGLENGIRYHDYAHSHLRLLLERAKYNEMIHYCERYYEKVNKKTDHFSVIQKLFYLDKMIPYLFIFGKTEGYKNLLLNFEELLITLPKHSNHFFVFMIDLYRYKLLLSLYMDNSKDFLAIYQEASKKIEERAIDFIYPKMLKILGLVPLVINYHLQKRNYEKCIYYIKTFQKNKGISSVYDLTLDYNFYYYSTKLLYDLYINGRINLWKKCNFNNYEGEKENIILDYLQKAVTISKQRGHLQYVKSWAFKIRILLDFNRLDLVNLDELEQLKGGQGYNQILSLYTLLLYYFFVNDKNNFNILYKNFVEKIDHFKEFSFYREWIESLREIDSFINLEEKEKLIQNKKKTGISKEKALKFIDFIQEQIDTIEKYR